MGYRPCLVALRGSRRRLNPPGFAAHCRAANPAVQPGQPLIGILRLPVRAVRAEPRWGCPGRQIGSKSSDGDMTNSRALALWGR